LKPLGHARRTDSRRAAARVPDEEGTETNNANTGGEGSVTPQRAFPMRRELKRRWASRRPNRRAAPQRAFPMRRELKLDYAVHVHEDLAPQRAFPMRRELKHKPVEGNLGFRSAAARVPDEEGTETQN